MHANWFDPEAHGGCRRRASGLRPYPACDHMWPSVSLPEPFARAVCRKSAQAAVENLAIAERVA
jgi:hypothetical protein